MRAAALVALALCCRGVDAQTATQRLSDWLRARPGTPDDYPLGLQWRSRAETAPQSALRLGVLGELSRAPWGGGDRASAQRLAEWLAGLPVTGRVPVTLADRYWLEVNPASDPVLGPGDAVVMPRRPRTLTVITGGGERCTVTHAPGREARAYLDACGAGAADQVWVVQPDGVVRRSGVAAWNAETQDEPAPGAWIWSPGRDHAWSDGFSDRFAAFLATQGPAPDAEAASPAPAPAARSRARSLDVTASDWGGIGLLQTPTARMAGEGELRFDLSRVAPYTRATVVLQPFDWLEAGFRYSDIGNRAYGAPELSGTQSAKDKSFDAKLRLWRESRYLPEAAVGLRDLTGTGLFAGEYFVASKRYGPLDVSAGLGWGYVGGRGDVRNPLRVFGRSFETRANDVGQGGNFSTKSWFHGPAAWFGGVQLQTPWRPLVLKLEYDGNDYRHEPLANNQRQRSPWNFGLVYRVGRSADLSLGVERGDTVMLALALHTDMSRLGTPKTADPPPVPVSVAPGAAAPEWSATSREIERQTGWAVRRISRQANELRIDVEDAGAVYWRERVDRAVAVLHRDAPAAVDRFVFAYRQLGVDVAEHVVERAAWVAERTRPLPPAERRETVAARDPGPAAAGAPALHERKRPAFDAAAGVVYGQTVGGPDAFILYQVAAVGRAKLWLGDATWLQGTAQLRLIDNYGRFRYTAPSDMPRVRTFLREYITTSRLTLPNLQLTHVERLGASQYASVYAGYLEPMFAGVGAEWLVRPFARRTAFGIDLNRVQQRNFRQDLGFDDAGSQTGYRVTTGHASLYWDTGVSDVIAKLSAGRYLAGDSGVTLDLSRVFSNGLLIGAFVTKTNVPAARFGEGSFDKGIYLAIPFDAFLSRSSNAVAGFSFRPLTRDGGAKLGRAVELYDLTGARDERTLRFAPAPAR